MLQMGIKNYQYIIENEQCLLEAIKRGLISYTVINHKVYYERYLQELNKCKEITQAIFNTSQEFEISTRTVNRAIAYMTR